MGVDESRQPYREGRLKRQVRRRFASKESRKGLPKVLCARERRVVHVLGAMALTYLVGMIILSETGHPLWMQTACLIQCLFSCALAGLYESASDWQRAALHSRRSRDARVAQLLEEDSSGLSEAEIIAMTGDAADIGFATGDEVAEAFRRELGDE